MLGWQIAEEVGVKAVFITDRKEGLTVGIQATTCPVPTRLVYSFIQALERAMTIENPNGLVVLGGEKCDYKSW